MVEKVCVVCGVCFAPYNGQQKVCSEHCRKTHNASLARKRSGALPTDAIIEKKCRVCGNYFTATGKQASRRKICDLETCKKISRAEYSAKWKAANPDVAQASWRKRNSKITSEQRKAYYEANLKTCRRAALDCYYRNRERYLDNQKMRYRENHDKYREQERDYRRRNAEKLSERRKERRLSDYENSLVKERIKRRRLFDADPEVFRERDRQRRREKSLILSTIQALIEGKSE